MTRPAPSAACAQFATCRASSMLAELLFQPAGGVTSSVPSAKRSNRKKSEAPFNRLDVAVGDPPRRHDLDRALGQREVAQLGQARREHQRTVNTDATSST